MTISSRSNDAAVGAFRPSGSDRTVSSSSCRCRSAPTRADTSPAPCAIASTRRCCSPFAFSTARRNDSHRAWSECESRGRIKWSTARAMAASRTRGRSTSCSRVLQDGVVGGEHRRLKAVGTHRLALVVVGRAGIEIRARAPVMAASDHEAASAQPATCVPAEWVLQLAPIRGACRCRRGARVDRPPGIQAPMRGRPQLLTDDPQVRRQTTTCSSTDRGVWCFRPHLSRLRLWFQTIPPRYSRRWRISRTEEGAHACGRPCCARGVGAPAAFSVLAMAFVPCPAAHNSKMRRTTVACSSLMCRSTVAGTAGRRWWRRRRLRCTGQRSRRATRCPPGTADARGCDATTSSSAARRYLPTV